MTKCRRAGFPTSRYRPVVVCSRRIFIFFSVWFRVPQSSRAAAAATPGPPVVYRSARVRSTLGVSVPTRRGLGYRVCRARRTRRKTPQTYFMYVPRFEWRFLKPSDDRPTACVIVFALFRNVNTRHATGVSTNFWRVLPSAARRLCSTGLPFKRRRHWRRST